MGITLHDNAMSLSNTIPFDGKLVTVEGDINQDDILNIQDIIIVVGQILGTISLDDEGFSIGDINNDDIIDILDIVKMVDNVMSGQSSDWDFEEQWTGDESYIFELFISILFLTALN